MCKKVIEMLGGILNCRSKIGRGTTCTITMPLEVLPYSQDNTKRISEKESWTLLGESLFIYLLFIIIIVLPLVAPLFFNSIIIIKII